MRRSRSRFSSAGAGYRCTCSTNLWNKNANRSPWYCIHKYGRTPSGCADWRNSCSSFRSSCCGWRIRNPNRRSSGNRLRAGAAMLEYSAPSFHRNSCGRLRRWFHACSGRNRSYIPDNRFWCKSHHFHSPAPMYGCRRKGRSRIHSCRRRAPCKRKCQDF